jgi:hypothetical protein
MRQQYNFVNYSTTTVRIYGIVRVKHSYKIEIRLCEIRPLNIGFAPPASAGRDKKSNGFSVIVFEVFEVSLAFPEWSVFC